MDEIEVKEKELDCAMALQNLREMHRQKLMHLIPSRAHAAPNAHIITPDLAPSMSIPPYWPLISDRIPSQVRSFHAAMSTIAPKLVKILQGQENLAIFTQRVAKRGSNLFLAGNVLQVMVEEHELDNWWVRFSVGASMKFPTYKCYCILNANNGVVCQICECKNG